MEPMKINLLPFVVEALGNNKRVYKDIDKLYQSNKYEFYKVAKEHELYNHQIIKEGSLIQEEYCKKVLGILISVNEDIETYKELQKIIKKGFHYTWIYLKNHNTVSLKDFIVAFKRKFKGIFDNFGVSIEFHSAILLFLSLNQAKNLKQDDFLNEFLYNLNLRWNHYNDLKSTRVSIDKSSDEDREKLQALKESIYKKYREIKDYNDILAGQFDLKKMESSAFIFDYENLSSISIFEDIDFTERDIEEVLYLYIIADKDLENIQYATEFLIAHMYIKYLIKAYKQVKEMYFANNKETIFVELEGLEKSLNATEGRLFSVKTDLNKANEKIEQLEKENTRLRKELEEEKRNREELNSLREFIFNLDKQEEYVEDEIDLEILKSCKSVIIGGHERWQQKMKEHLPNFDFIHPDNLNFDTRLLDDVSIIFIYVNYLNHGIYYKVMENISGKGTKVVYLNQQNEDLVLQEIYKHIKD